MKKSSKQSKRLPTPILVALIGAGALVIAALIPLIDKIGNQEPIELSISVHVTDQNGGNSIQGAKVMLFLEGIPFVEFTDSNGISTFIVTAPKNSRARLFVETDQFEIYDSNIQLKENQDIKIQLTPKGGDNKKIIVRVVDDYNSIPIEGASVVLIESGNTYSETTDSNGLAKFTISFVEDQIEAEISVSTSSYTINQQNVTLRPDEVQDVRLNQNTRVLIVASLEAITSNSTGENNSTTYGEIVTGALAVPAQVGKYTFIGGKDDVILIVLARTSGDFWPQIRLYGPDGNEIQTAKSPSASAELNATLPIDGVYVIFVNDGRDNTHLGDYSLSLQVINR